MIRIITVGGIPKLCRKTCTIVLVLLVKVQLHKGKLNNYLHLSHPYDHPTIISDQSHMDCEINTYDL